MYEGSYRSGKTGKSQGKFLWSAKGQGKSFFVKVRENEKLVPPDVRFSGQNVSNLFSAVLIRSGKLSFHNLKSQGI